jgi:serine protease Do
LVVAARLATGQEPAPGGSPPSDAPATAEPAAEPTPPPCDSSTAVLYQKLKEASVEVMVDDHLNGSGFFVDGKGLLMTAAHVIDRPDRRFEILSTAAGRVDIEVVAVDLGHDLALLRVKQPRPEGYPVLKLAETFPAPGEDVFLLGAAVFRHAVLLRGAVARDDTAFEYYTDKYVEVIHVAATVQSGTSGGPWVDRAGEIVGLQSGVMSINSIPVGVANVIPLSAIRDLIQNPRTKSTPAMGAAFEETWQQKRDFLDRFPPRTEGLVVRNLLGDNPAARAGLKQWDVVVAADGQKVRLSGELLRIIRQKQPGQSVNLTVLGPDGTGTREVSVVLGKLEVAWPPGATSGP